jgi:DNA-directed RNA polymerase subunit RPC12/RpoP
MAWYSITGVREHVFAEKHIDISHLFFPQIPLLYTMKCACCGTDMLPDKELENTVIYKCKECGLTDSRINDIG